jgi:hypothetical protein
VWLYGAGHRPDVGVALYRSRIEYIHRLTDGDLLVSLIVHDAADFDLLATETRSWSGTEMPGVLDLAFEAALPAADWPIFNFTVQEGSDRAATRLRSR